MSNKVPSVDHFQAVATLEDCSEKLAIVSQTELVAAISHWILNPELADFYCPTHVSHMWQRELTLLAERDSPRSSLPSGKGSPAEPRVDTGSIQFPPPEAAKFTFSDLFAGIGGFRLALQELGGNCVFSCEWDRSAKLTYFRNFGVMPYGDIKQFACGNSSDERIDRSIPYHDVLTAGFPCQPFSLAGMPARNHYGQAVGLTALQGSAFFDLLRIARVKRPRALFLENVRNILSIDDGNTFSSIRQALEQDLGYEFHYAIIDSSTTVPQRRKRCYIVAFREWGSGFEFPDFSGSRLPLKSILESQVADKYTISDRLWSSHLQRSLRNRARGTGFTVKLADVNEPSPTLVARYGKDGKECLISQMGRNPRKLTPLECKRLQGFPAAFMSATSDTSSYREFGNAVTVPVVSKIGASIVQALTRLENAKWM